MLHLLFDGIHESTEILYGEIVALGGAIAAKEIPTDKVRAALGKAAR